MSFRTVVITKRCKLDLKMDYLVVRQDTIRRIHIDDIEMLIVENPAISITGCLMSKLVEKKVKVVFCDTKRNPQYELSPLYGSHDCSRKIKVQNMWSEQIKGEVWTAIVQEKIRKQSEFLLEIEKEKEAKMLQSYIKEMEFRDETNREGHAAKVYFNALFGMDFTRNDNVPTNAALNYGYSIILSAINREISANGYLTQLGLFHDNMYNQFNLSSDLMEPFRIIVDRFVYHNSFDVFETEEKHYMLQILQQSIGIENTSQILTNGLKIYVRSVFDALCENDTSRILFYTI